MNQRAEELKARTKRFALDVCQLLKRLPYAEPGPTARRQLAKFATSIAVNYRATCRSRRGAEFIAKIGCVAEEADETQFWLEFAADSKMLEGPDLVRLRQESR